MAFHHDAHGRAAFGPKKGAGNPHIAPKAGARPVHKAGEPEKPMAPHGAQHTEKHVTETHPGKTKPHPVTGVHAHHAHHTGGGMYTTHTHHDDGTVETKDNLSADEMHADHNEAFPAQNEADNEEQSAADGTNYAEDLAEGVGGTAV